MLLSSPNGLLGRSWGRKCVNAHKTAIVGSKHTGSWNDTVKSNRHVLGPLYPVATHASTAAQETGDASRRQSNDEASTSGSQEPQRAASRSKRTEYELVDTADKLVAMLEELRNVDCIALDCEGEKLGHKDGGKLSLMQIGARVGGKSAPGMNGLKIWVVDVTQLRWKSLQYRTKDKAVSLKKILEDSKVTKLLYDVRSDSAQLSQEYDVRMRSVYDLQLAEVAARQIQNIPTTWVLPLQKALESYVERTPGFEADMVMGLQVATTYHYSNKTEIWEQRPLTDELLQYAAVDVKYLHQLQDAVNRKLPKQIQAKVKAESAARVQAPTVASEARANAPTIVTKSDMRNLFRVRPSSNAPSSSSSSSKAGPKPGPGDGSSDASSSSSADAAAEAEVRARKAPPLLAISSPLSQPGASSMEGSSSSSSSSAPEGGEARQPPSVLASPSSTASSFLLQPKKRDPNQGLPAWVLAAQEEQAAREAAKAAAEAGGSDEVGAGPGSSDASAGSSNGVHVASEAAAESSVAGTSQQEQSSQAPADDKPATSVPLLWKPSAPASAAQQGPGASKPVMKPPPRRPV